jgi:hypothetical protein
MPPSRISWLTVTAVFACAPAGATTTDVAANRPHKQSNVMHRTTRLQPRFDSPIVSTVLDLQPQC